MSKMSYMEIATAFQSASKHCLEKSGSYSTISGTYESLLAGIVADLPIHKQQEVMRALGTTRSFLEKVYPA